MSETKKMTPEEFRAKFHEMIQRMKERAEEAKKIENAENAKKAEALKELLNKLKRDE